MIGLANTGTGKTAAFTLPIIDRLLDGPRRTRVLILTPTRELAAQVDDSFRKYGKHSGLGVAAVFGGVPLEPQERALRQGVDVIVATPGRLIDHIERQNVVFDDLEVLVLDEADRMGGSKAVECSSSRTGTLNSRRFGQPSRNFS